MHYINVCSLPPAIAFLVTIDLFLRRSDAQDSVPVRLVALFCFLFVWIGVWMGMILAVEGWQMALTIPGPHSQTMPGTGSLPELILRQLVYVAPVRRVVLGTAYALPFLLVPLVAALANRARAVPILRGGYAVCLAWLVAETVISYILGLPQSVQAAWSLGSWVVMLAGLLWVALRAGQPADRVAVA